MKLTISRRAALSAAFVAAAARVFIAHAVDGPSIHNGLWIAALLGALPALLYLKCLDGFLELRTQASRPPLMLFLLIVTLLDAACVLSGIARSSGYLSLEDIPHIGLLLPLCLVALWCLWRNGDAVGYAAMLWVRLFPALLLVVVLLQLRHYRPEWLRPILGNDWRSIFREGVLTAGLFVPTSAILFVSDDSEGGEETRGRTKAPAIIAGAAPVASLLIALRLMMAPTGVQELEWSQRLDALLTNGRAPLYLQFPMIVLWFIALFQLLATECFAASTLLQRLVPRLNGHVCAAIVVLVCAAMSLSGLQRFFAESTYMSWVFIIGSALIALSILAMSVLKGGDRPCGG